MKAVIFSFTCSLLIVFGQVLWKIAIDKNGGLINSNQSLIDNIMNYLTSGYMLSGLLVYFFATIYWMYLLGRYEYSYIYPMFSMTYIISIIFASIIFNESITIYKIIGIIFIVIGVVIIAKFGDINTAIDM